MSRIFIDGFESGGTDLWDLKFATVVAAGGMDGNYHLDCNANTEYIQKDISAVDEMYFAFLYNPTTLGYSGQMFSIYKDSTLIGHISRSTTTRLIRLYSGAGGLLGTGTKVLMEGTIYLIEFHIKIADSGGRAEIKVDGIQDIDFTGDTKPGTDTQFDKVRLGYKGTADCRAYFDNFIMDDSAWIGDTNIQAVVPTGAGNTTGWTPSAGNNWECVDEKPYNDTDYVAINSNDVTDTYAAGNMAGSVGDIKCVQVQSRAVLEGAPTPTNLKLVVRSGGTDYFSGDKSVGIVVKSFSNLWEDNPADASAWEEADVNAMEIGVKSAA